jgi:hypothetical protein
MGGECSTYGRCKNPHKTLVGKLYGKLGVNGKIILKWISVKQGATMWNGLIWLVQYPAARSHEYSNKH